MHFKSSVYSASLTLPPVGGSQHSPAGWGEQILIADTDSEAASGVKTSMAQCCRLLCSGWKDVTHNYSFRNIWQLLGIDKPFLRFANLHKAMHCPSLPVLLYLLKGKRFPLVLNNLNIFLQLCNNFIEGYHHIMLLKEADMRHIKVQKEKFCIFLHTDNKEKPDNFRSLVSSHSKQRVWGL